MLRHLVLWQIPLRVAGACDADAAVARILSLLASEGRGVGTGERLVGRVHGREVRVWRSAPLAQPGDTVELSGELRDTEDGSALEGVLRYRLRTRVQFLGCLLIAAALALAGLARLGKEAGGIELVAIGAGVGLATLLWIYSSRQMVEHQARFIRERLARALGEGGS